MSICLGCGEEFTKNSNAQKYCSYRCGDKIRSKLYRDSHVEELKRRRSQRYREDSEYRDAIRARHERWGKLNQEWKRAYNRHYGRQNRDRANAHKRAWYRKNTARWLEKEARRRAAKFHSRPIETCLTDAQWRIILEVWDHKCAYCSTSSGRLTQDHVIPLSKGGAHTVENVVPACRPCNSSKFNLDVDDFFDRVKFDRNCNHYMLTSTPTSDKVRSNG